MYSRDRPFTPNCPLYIPTGEEWADVVGQRFSGEVHPHLISLQAAYRQGDTHGVILPWADRNLLSLWKTSSLGDPLSEPNLLWILSQCVGIASGLRKIHRYRSIGTAVAERTDVSPDSKRIGCLHGDITPQNILLFRDHTNPEAPGRLVLTDFGLMRFDIEETDSDERLVSATYRAPEHDMQGYVASRYADIWSLGCVFLEFIAWYLGGPELLNHFVILRKVENPLYGGWLIDDFFEVVRSERGSSGTVYVRVKREVLDVGAYLEEALKRRIVSNKTKCQFINNELHAHPKCSEPVHDLLEFITERMLVIESKGIRKRADSCEVHRALLEIHQTASKLQTLTATPRPKVESVPEAVEMPLNLQEREMAQSRYSELRTHSGRTRTTV
jgi:serine/threonine protein kinase